MLLFVSSGVLALTVSAKRRELDESEARWLDAEGRLLADVASVSAELDALRASVAEEVKAGNKNLGPRVLSVLEESKKKDKERAARSADAVLFSSTISKGSDIIPKMSFPGFTTSTPPSGPPQSPSKFMV